MKSRWLRRRCFSLGLWRVGRRWDWIFIGCLLNYSRLSLNLDCGENLRLFLQRPCCFWLNYIPTGGDDCDSVILPCRWVKFQMINCMLECHYMYQTLKLCNFITKYCYEYFQLEWSNEDKEILLKRKIMWSLKSCEIMYSAVVLTKLECTFYP